MPAPNSSGAAAPGLVTPESDEAALQGGLGGAVEKRESLGFADAEAERKAVATLTALFALRGGHQVRQRDAGGYIVYWRGLSRECRDLEELEAHARRVGVTR